MKLGRLIGFIPMPVIMGFTSGIAIIIALGQVDNFFGTVSRAAPTSKSSPPTPASASTRTSRPSSSARWSSPSCSVWPKKWGAKIPGSLIGIIAATALAAVLEP